MRGLKKFFLLSLIFHLGLLGVFSREFPAQKAYPTVRVRLTSLAINSSSPGPLRKNRSSPVKKAVSSSPKRKPRKRNPERPVRRKKVPSRKRFAGKRKPALERRKKTAPARENGDEILEERLADLKREEVLRKKLRELERKLKEERGSAGSGGTARGNPSPGYTGIFKTHIESFWEVPLALEKKKNLSATVRLRISARGELLSYKLLRSSGNELFDRAVLAAVKAAAPYPAPGTPVTIKAIFTPGGLRL